MSDVRIQQSPPAGWTWGHWNNPDGQRLRYGRSGDGPGGDILLLPGLGEFGEKYFELLSFLSSRGFRTWALDWCGQGGSDRLLPDPLKVDSGPFEKHVRDLERFVREVVRPDPNRNLVLYGHSFGGHIALLSGALGRLIADGLILTAPALALKLGRRPGWLTWLQAELMLAVGRGSRFGFPVPDPGGAIGNDADSGLTSDRERGALSAKLLADQPGLRTDGPTWRWVRELCRSQRRLCRPRVLTRIPVPVLAAVPSEDVLLDAVAVRHALNSGLRSARVLWLAGAHHDVHMEADAYLTPWKREIVSFLETLATEQPVSNQRRGKIACVSCPLASTTRRDWRSSWTTASFVGSSARRRGFQAA